VASIVHGYGYTVDLPFVLSLFLSKTTAQPNDFDLRDWPLPLFSHKGRLAQEEMCWAMQAFQGHTKCYSLFSIDMALSMFAIQ